MLRPIQQNASQCRRAERTSKYKTYQQKKEAAAAAFPSGTLLLILPQGT
jgi:hypothetical protein